MVRSVVLVSICTVAGSKEYSPIRQSLVDRINDRHARGNSTWTAAAARHNRFVNFSLDELRALMGLQVESDRSRSGSNFEVGAASIPASFDGRTEFSSCQKAIRDQAGCGSCWAFAASETLTTNLCVLGTGNPILSPQDLISCDTSDRGCSGGSLLNVWNYIDSNGIRSDDCVPYTSGDGSESTCSVGCSGYGSSDHYKCPVTSSFLTSDTAIQAAVMTVGAVEVGFSVYEDFMNYNGGIYSYQEGQYLGGHAVKIVGWGKQISMFFWLVQNSWGPGWGENGYFRIVNWHDDKQSAFAIGGGNACIQGATPEPPTPAPTPPTCEDIVSYCSDYGRSQCEAKSYIIPVCKETCGCCDAYKPSYCSDEHSFAGALI